MAGLMADYETDLARPFGVVVSGGGALTYPQPTSKFLASASTGGPTTVKVAAGGYGVAVNAGTYTGIRTNKSIAPGSGKFQLEGQLFIGSASTNGSCANYGIVNNSWGATGRMGDANSIGWYINVNQDPVFYATNATGFSTDAQGKTILREAILGLLVDTSAGMAWPTVDGVAIVGNPVTGTGGLVIPAGSISAAVCMFYYGDGAILNTGQVPFYFPATGFQPWG